MRVFCLLSALVLPLVICDRFEEELLVKDFGNGFSGFHFNFVTQKKLGDDHHFHIFPKPLYNILTKYSVSEFHLSMVKGHWDRLKWGPPFVPSASGGAEIWAWFSPTTSNVDASWTYFLEALSGQFCASLSQLGLPKNYISPSLSHRPSGLFQKITSQNVSSVFRYAQFSHEEVCTENLTPWSKLLPCKKIGGLASMLKPKSIFKATYSALFTDVRCDDKCKQFSLELKQSLTIVFDRRHMYGSIQEPWSLIGLLGDEMTKSCPVASRSEIIILSSQPQLLLDPPADVTSIVNWDVRRVLAVYSPSYNFANNLTITSFLPIETPRSSTVNEEGVSVMKYSTGKGDVGGGVRVELRNNLAVPVPVVLLDSAPWYAEIYFSSLTITRQYPDGSAPVVITPDKVTFQPSVRRKQMAFLELLLTLPPGACVTVSYAFTKVLMRWNEYLPDANHGVYLPAASVVYQFSPEQLDRLRASRNPVTWELALPLWASTYAEYLSAANTSRQGTKPLGDGLLRLYSEALLIRLPVPDFSMPFNALCLVCSVVAILFGSIHKLTTCGLVPVVAEGDEDVVDKPPIVRLFQKLKILFQRLHRRSHLKNE
ncbi:unnamed protein product [Mesocestoides corti]|uniref:GPI transamidase component PIG-T n=1 Tax=Mesocestoides corti TaxID=53468 RepID=A0A0R3UHA6_MESCO|nr:unnamed protein product [Mesocestoides corti]